MANDPVIVEHVSSVWSYHWARPGSIVALCGKTGMMATNLPQSLWGQRTHLHEKWCAECQAKAERHD
jgi:hypothetical protein